MPKEDISMTAYLSLIKWFWVPRELYHQEDLSYQASVPQCLCTSSALSMNVLYPLFPAWQMPHCLLLQCLAKDWEAMVFVNLSAVKASESPPGCTPCLEMHTPDSPTSRPTGIPSCLAPRTGGTQGRSISNNWTDLQSSKNEVVRLSNQPLHELPDRMQSECLSA